MAAKGHRIHPQHDITIHHHLVRRSGGLNSIAKFPECLFRPVLCFLFFLPGIISMSSEEGGGVVPNRSKVLI